MLTLQVLCEASYTVKAFTTDLTFVVQRLILVWSFHASSIDRQQSCLCPHRAGVSAEQGTANSTWRILAIEVCELLGLELHMRPVLCVVLPEVCLQILNPGEMVCAKDAAFFQVLAGFRKGLNLGPVLDVDNAQQLRAKVQ